MLSLERCDWGNVNVKQVSRDCVRFLITPVCLYFSLKRFGKGRASNYFIPFHRFCAYWNWMWSSQTKGEKLGVLPIRWDGWKGPFSPKRHLHLKRWADYWWHKRARPFFEIPPFPVLSLRDVSNFLHRVGIYLDFVDRLCFAWVYWYTNSRCNFYSKLGMWNVIFKFFKIVFFSNLINRIRIDGE